MILYKLKKTAKYGLDPIKTLDPETVPIPKVGTGSTINRYGSTTLDVNPDPEYLETSRIHVQFWIRIHNTGCNLTQILFCSTFKLELYTQEPENFMSPRSRWPLPFPFPRGCRQRSDSCDPCQQIHSRYNSMTIRMEVLNHVEFKTGGVTVACTYF
jgi:hypothetical protein